MRGTIAQGPRVREHGRAARSVRWQRRIAHYLQAKSMPPSRVKQDPSTLSPFWWTPLAFIALALVIVFTVPFMTSSRLQGIRMFTAEFLSPALVRTNDLEAGLATVFAARSELAEGRGQSSAAVAAESSARLAMHEDEQVLDSLVRHAGIEEITLFAEARASIAAWQREEAAFAASAPKKPAASYISSLPGARGRRWDALQRALADLQKLEDALARHTASDRARITRLERFSVIVPGGVVPLALLALAAVAWTARKTVLLSQAAVAGQRSAELAMASKSALMRGVTHDLKNPLGAARGYADLLADGELGPLPDAQTKMIRRLRSLLTSTLDTVDDLVELSRAEAGALPIDQRESDVVTLARELLDDFRPSADSAGLQLSFVLAAPAGAIPSVTTDPARVRQVLGNLMSNAVKYTPRGGRVEMRVAVFKDNELGSVVACEVCDTGAGIPDGLRERVFEEFFRVPATVAMAPGTGVGLAIARRVARLLGGDLRVRGTEGGGATFSLLIPVTERVA